MLSADARLVLEALRWWAPDACLAPCAVRGRGDLGSALAFQRRFDAAFVELVATGLVTVGGSRGRRGSAGARQVCVPT